MLHSDGWFMSMSRPDFRGNVHIKVVHVLTYVCRVGDDFIIDSYYDGALAPGSFVSEEGLYGEPEVCVLCALSTFVVEVGLNRLAPDCDC